MLIVLGVLSVVALTALTGWFVLQEFAYVSVDRGRLQAAAQQGDASAQRAVALTGRLSFVLSGAQLGITVTALLVGYVSEPLLGEGLAHALGFSGMSYAARLTLSLLVTLVFSTAVQMVLGELAPKNWAIAAPERLARRLSRSTTAYLWVAGPLIRVFDRLSNTVLRWVGIEPVEELPQGATSEELEHIVAASHREGLVDHRLTDLLQHTLQFDDLRVDQVMTPRVDVHTAPADAPASHVVELLATGRSRFPVVGDSVDDIVGVVGLTDLLQVPRERWSVLTVADIASPAVTVPGIVSLQAALELLRSEKRQLAVVLDEYGGLEGVITFEDVAEEVAGPILDEYDPHEPHPERHADGWMLPGRTRIDELPEATGWVIEPVQDVSTVGGLVLQRLGSTAEVGDRAELEARRVDGEDDTGVVTLEVHEVSRHVPERVRMTVRPVVTEDPVP